MRTTLPSLALVFALTACTSITGTGGATDFECKAPKGVPCMSMSGVYANIRAGNVPGLNGSVPNANEPTASEAQASPAKVTDSPGPYGGSPKVALTTPGSLGTAAQAQPGAFDKVSPTAMNVPASGTPLRTPERILRIWIAPMEDSEGTLHDQRYAYVQVDRGQWLLRAFQESGRQMYAPVKRLPSSEKAEAKQVSPAESAQDAARRNGALFVPGATGQPKQAEAAAGSKE